jgi:malonate-semialdehyde dehydrogenase (acetylating)/methylmalonate-semialdehyde dehydrogenase
MAISVAVPVGEKTANALVERLVPRVRALKVGPGIDPEAEMGPLIPPAINFDRLRGLTLLPQCEQVDSPASVD